MEQITGLYIITDQQICPGRTHLEIAKAAIKGGAKIVQIRDKHATDREFYQAALDIRELTQQTGVAFIVNDRVHIAAAVGADGVNVGQTDMPIHAVRRVLGDSAIIGVSCDNLSQAQQAEVDGADYIGFGPVFPTSTKLDTGPVSGLDQLKEVCATANIPVVAIGGIGASNISQVSATRAASAAVVSAVVCAEDMAQATAELIGLFLSERCTVHSEQ